MTQRYYILPSGMTASYDGPDEGTPFLPIYEVTKEAFQSYVPAQTLQQKMDALFKEAPAAVQAQFWSLRLAVQDALKEDPTGAIAYYIVLNAPNVPVQYQGVQQQILALLPVPKQ